MTRVRLILISLVGLLMLTAGYLAGLPRQEPLSTSSETNLALEFWRQQFPDYELIKWGQGDLNADGCEDTVVIYQVDRGRCMMQVVIARPRGYRLTGPCRAPSANQEIDFKDIDGTAPVELIITGMKGGNVGYAVFRLKGNRLINLFNRNMDKCCLTIPSREQAYLLACQ